MDVKALKAQGERLFEKKKNLDVLWQTIADSFYPERAHFTVQRDPGDEFAAHLMSGYPIMARRDLGNAIESMLRRDKWFHIGTRNKEVEDRDVEAKRWLEWARDRQRKMMYDPKSGFVRAAKEVDHDFVAFGQGVMTIEVYEYRQLLYRSWHLKDVAWSEGMNRQVDTVHLRHKMLVRDVCRMFKGGAHADCHAKMSQGKGFEELDCEWIVYPDEEGTYVSVHLDRQHDHIMEEKLLKYFPFIIPRWQTVSESQYAYSPAVVAGLPDARLLQAMTLTLLEAGEMSVRPPMLAVQEAIRSDIQLVSGGITWTDAQYDERLGEVLRPLTQDRGGFPAAFRIEESVKLGIADSFFLNKLNLPITGEMTAYEVQQRVQEFIRNTLPLFQPLEYEYSAAVCDRTFEVLMLHNAFAGSRMPRSLSNQDVEFKFESPLQAATDRERVEQFRSGLELVATAMQVDPNVAQVPNFTVALRDALAGLGAPATWYKSEEEANEAVEAARSEEEEQRAMATAMEAAKAMPRQAARA